MSKFRRDILVENKRQEANIVLKTKLLFQKPPKYISCCHFSANSLAIEHFTARSECSSMRMVSKHWFFILFEFASLQPRQALLLVFLCFHLVSCVRIAYSDYFTESGSFNKASQMLVAMYSSCSFVSDTYIPKHFRIL